MFGQYKFSNYTFCLPLALDTENVENIPLLLYNSASGAIVRFTEPDVIASIHNTKQLDEFSLDDEFPDEDIRSFLVQKRFVVPADTDEYRYQYAEYLNQSAHNRILELVLIITRQCNLRCVYCYEEHLDLHMDANIYHNILLWIEREYQAKNYSGVSIALFGGEPLYKASDVISFLQQVQALSAQYGCWYSAGITTNGVLLSPDIFEALFSAGCCNYSDNIRWTTT